MKILVTGSSGFIGNELTKQLISMNHSVMGIDKVVGQNTTHVINILDFFTFKEAVLEFGPTVIYHLAAETDIDSTKKIDDYKSNTNGIKNLVNVCNLCPTLKTVFFTSTIHVHRLGYTSNDFFTYWPQSSYGESKVFGEQYLMQHLHADIVVFRLNSIWSEKAACVYTPFLNLSASGRIFRTPGRGALITFGHLENVTSALINSLALEAEKMSNYPIYLGDYEPYNMNDWIQIIAKQNGRSTIIVPTLLLTIFGRLADVLGKLGFNSPISKKRIENFTTDRVYEMSRTKSLFGEEKVNYKTLNYKLK